MPLPRRTFLQLSTTAALAPQFLFTNQLEKSGVPPLVAQVPPMLDHILLGCNDLQRGIAFVELRTGVRATFGGVHPGRGTQNALLSLGTRRYLEIIAPDPQQHTENPLAKKLQSLAEPGLVGWAAHPGDISALAAKLKSQNIPAEVPTPGSRKRPDGKVLHWQTLNLADDANGLLPFFIQWSADSLHPSEDAPKGCQLLRFELLTPDSASLSKILAQLTLDVPFVAAAAATLHAIITGPKGSLSLDSLPSGS